MRLTSGAMDKLSHAAVYLLLMGGVIWGGAQLINRSLESKCYHHFFRQWEIAFSAYLTTHGVLPRFSGNNHVAYMDALVEMMMANHIPVPESNEARPYTYRLRRIGSPAENLFILCTGDALIVYGISAETFQVLDRAIDGKGGMSSGGFTGRRGRDGKTIIGHWKL